MVQSRTPDILVQVMAEFRSVVGEMAALRGELVAFKATVGPIVTIIQGDSQRAPLAQSVAVLQRDLEHNTASLKGTKDRLEHLEQTDKASRVAIVVACITGISSLVAAVLSYFRH